MFDWQIIIHAIDHELGTPTATRALIVGFVTSIGGTQLLKYLPHLDRLRDRSFRWSVRLLAFWLAVIPCYALWPEAGTPGVLVAVALGLIAPSAYLIGVRSAVHFLPWLDPHLSARPDP